MNLPFTWCMSVHYKTQPLGFLSLYYSFPWIPFISHILSLLKSVILFTEGFDHFQKCLTPSLKTVCHSLWVMICYLNIVVVEGVSGPTVHWVCWPLFLGSCCLLNFLTWLQPHLWLGFGVGSSGQGGCICFFAVPRSAVSLGPSWVLTP